ncbi:MULTISPECIES: antibiotic biosynthesis monooxygenase family protein [Sphingobacterium]|uniref:Antibiotic biosynthesis monooxygenase family protein n=1 Tax=Sphingobacterium populi TaxID=1812824 RepID=A0ABW5UE69_9SPHI|nr:antibiotic biosynthesis monooxygenase [Sphingobacterium sp. CFCC 11742]
MILEQATLLVRAGQEQEFERDFKTASAYISAIDGYLSHSLHRCIEVSNQYLLLVEWTSLEAHEIGFRQSAQYLKWKELLHHYYDPFPQVFHYTTV